jgi:hypothetical protein
VELEIPSLRGGLCLRIPAGGEEDEEEKGKEGFHRGNGF